MRRKFEGLTALDWTTNIVFVGVLTIVAVTFTSYGPEAACHHIAEVITSSAPSIASTDSSDWAAMAD